MVLYSQRTKKLSEIDEKIAKGSESLCSSINQALLMNKTLESLYLECASVQSPPQLIALQTKGLLIEQQQDFQLMMSQKKFFEIKKYFEAKYRLPIRKIRGPCGLPGLLSCLDTQIFRILRKKLNENGGSIGTSFKCKEIRWEFQDLRVKEL